MAKPTSFQEDIRPLFTERDIHAMSKAFNLGSYDDVKAHGAAIYDRIRGIGSTVMAAPAAERRRSLASNPDRAIRQMDGGRVSTLKGGGRHVD
jgi:hypothetical protein